MALDRHPTLPDLNSPDSAGTDKPSRTTVDSRILQLTRRPPHYAYEAYEFVCEAVTFTQKRLGRMPDPDRGSAEDRHVTGAELLRGVCDLALQSFGMMAPLVFKRWNVRTTDDIGRIVFDLIAIGVLSKSDRDAPEDFSNQFELLQALEEGYELTLDPKSMAKRGDL